jgi:hypothetical protein
LSPISYEKIVSISPLAMEILGFLPEITKNHACPVKFEDDFTGVYPIK